MMCDDDSEDGVRHNDFIVFYSKTMSRLEEEMTVLLK